MQSSASAPNQGSKELSRNCPLGKSGLICKTCLLQGVGRWQGHRGLLCEPFLQGAVGRAKHKVTQRSRAECVCGGSGVHSHTCTRSDTLGHTRTHSHTHTHPPAANALFMYAFPRRSRPTCCAGSHHWEAYKTRLPVPPLSCPGALPEQVVDLCWSQGWETTEGSWPSREVGAGLKNMHQVPSMYI